MRTLKFKPQPTNAFFATVIQMFGDSSRLATAAERAVIESLSTVQTTKQCSAVSRKPEGAAEHLIDGSMLLKGVVSGHPCDPHPLIKCIRSKQVHSQCQSVTKKTAHLNTQYNNTLSLLNKVLIPWLRR